MSRAARINAQIEAVERTRAGDRKPPEVDFHDSTIGHLQKCRAEADDDATRRIFDQQIAIQKQRKAEAIALKADSRRRNAPHSG